MDEYAQSYLSLYKIHGKVSKLSDKFAENIYHERLRHLKSVQMVQSTTAIMFLSANQINWLSCQQYLQKK